MTAESAPYLLPDGPDSLREHLTLAAEPARRAVERTFFDTFDGRLHAEGLALVHEGGRLVLAGLGGHDERASAESARVPKRVIAGELSGPLRERLEPVIEMRAALPVARVRSRRQVLRVLDGEAKTVVRLVVEEQTPLQTRLHVVGVRGYDKALRRVCRVLEQDAGLAAADAPLFDEAVVAAGGVPGGVSSKLDLRLRPGDRADVAAAAVLGRLLEVIDANLPGTLDDVDTEFLHDFRVAVRRTRALQRELKDIFPPAPLAAYRAGFSWLQQVTGATRDLDVYLLDFDHFRASVPEGARGDLDPLHGLLAQRREAERRAMVRALRSERTTALLAGWARLVEGLGRTGEAAPISEVAGKRIHKVYRRMVRMGGAIDDGSPHEALHELRKQGKELRYLLEFFASLYSAEVVKPMVRTLKSLQDVLGEFQDREVQAATLRSLREDVAALPGGPAALMAMGLLVERIEEQQDAARAEFAERFAAFASKAQRQLVEATFG